MEVEEEEENKDLFFAVGGFTKRTCFLSDFEGSIHLWKKVQGSSEI